MKKLLKVEKIVERCQECIYCQPRPEAPGLICIHPDFDSHQIRQMRPESSMYDIKKGCPLEDSSN